MSLKPVEKKLAEGVYLLADNTMLVEVRSPKRKRRKVKDENGKTLKWRIGKSKPYTMSQLKRLGETVRMELMREVEESTIHQEIWTMKRAIKNYWAMLKEDKQHGLRVPTNPTTLKVKEGHFRKFLEMWGDCQDLNTLTTRAVRGYNERLTKHGLKRETRINIFGSLRALYKHANRRIKLDNESRVSEEPYLREPEWPSLARGLDDGARPTRMSTHQLNQLIEVAPTGIPCTRGKPPLKLILMLISLSTSRVRAVLEARRDQLRLDPFCPVCYDTREGQHCSHCKTALYVDGVFLFGSRKAGIGRFEKIAPLSRSAKSMLREWLLYSGHPEFIFWDPENKTVLPYSRLVRPMEAACDRVGMKRVLFHQCRKAAANEAESRGIDYRDLAWKSEAVFQKHYANANLIHPRDMSDKQLFFHVLEMLSRYRGRTDEIGTETNQAIGHLEAGITIAIELENRRTPARTPMAAG